MHFFFRKMSAPLAVVVRWLAFATAGWFVVLIGDAWVTRTRPFELAVAQVALSLALLASCAGVPLFLLLRLLLRRLLRSAARAHKAVQAVPLLALVASVLPAALAQAEFLTAGDAISSMPWSGALRVALVVFGDAALVALALWLLRLTAPATVPSWPPLAALWRVPTVVFVATGSIVAAVLLYAVIFELQFYEYLAAFLILPLWVLVTTLVGFALPSSRSLVVVCACCLAAAGVLSVGLKPAQDPNRTLRTRTASYTRLMLQLRRADAATVLDLSNPGRFRCEDEDRGGTVALAPLEGRIQNVILISVDALRPDVLSKERNGTPIAPHFRAFAAKSVELVNAQTTYPATLFSVGGALTGLSPSQLLFAPKPPPSLFRLTRKTLPNQIVVLPSSAWFKKPAIEALFLQGTRSHRRKGAKSQTTLFIQQLKAAKKSGKRTLAWLHYFEPHQPYIAHDDFPFGEDMVDLYHSEVAHLDRQLGVLVDYLESAGWTEDSLIVLFSDHGQALGERDYFGHHVYLDDFISDIVMMMRAPGLAPRRAEEMASIADIAPTVLHAVTLPFADNGAGISLLAAPRDADRHIIAEAFPLRGHQLFDLADEAVGDTNALEERVRRMQRSMKSYEPKVSIVNKDHRLIASRETSEWALYRRGEREEEVLQGAEDVEEALLEKIAEWHRRESERIYCRVRNVTR